MTNDYPRIVAAMRYITNQVDDAREAVDDAVAHAWERTSRGQEIDNIGGWVRIVALHNLRRCHRRRGVERRIHPSVATPDSVDAATPEAAIDMHRALATLTERQRQVVVLHYFLDVSVSEIANDLGLARGTIKATLHQSREALAKTLVPTDAMREQIA